MAIHGIALYLALAILIGAGCGSPAGGAADLSAGEAPAPVASSPREPKALVRVKKTTAEPRTEIALPRSGVVVAFMRWGATTLGVFDLAGAKMIPLATRETGILVAAQRGSRLATLVREGPNPAKNHIEILDWRSGKTVVVEPAADEAVLGFAFDSEGKQLSYAAMNLRNSRSTHVTWHVGLLDLEKEQARIVIDSSAKKISENSIPVPFAWAGRSGRLYLQGWAPFRGMIRQSLWAMIPEGGEPAKIVAAPKYTGAARLSPDGAQLSYLGSDMGSLPPEFVAPPGAPPGNLLSVMDLSSGGEISWARGGRSAFGAFDWSAGGAEIVAVGQDWIKGKFRDVEVRRIGKGGSLPVAKIDQSQTPKEVASILECRERNLFWVEKERAAAKLYVNREKNSQVLFEFPDGAIQLLGCFSQ